uniref:Uncharacterized protein n=1 Tax=Rhizochromulina marina TaxID=1034831 RepID=A0A7S2SS65_9STRA|mmetsp:Transcript_59/g.199  ORF Transcript_59/g.199 Transcript_59/m.199 type:complete len:216 (+) Transcript_59:39-686(+)|eukprot:CAMPEP_0118973694 /NCGR_PEP_ID=MMETSP1173-20130426/10753_1 /TAXON_ID=1034831 /ORGANISM="Rhizochromulina marina cf, Strain CCMP1243" /LENGTH=215 /DNA_ID=CAMNT_0006923385 /DNA_START=38 /DNA_END=685 /DNA_ORIENTATION=-
MGNVLTTRVEVDASVVDAIRATAASSAAVPVAPQASSAGEVHAIRGLNEDWERYDCSSREAAFKSLQCQNVLAAMRKCGLDVSKVKVPGAVHLEAPKIVASPASLVTLADYQSANRCQLVCSMMGVALTGVLSANLDKAFPDTPLAEKNGKFAASVAVGGSASTLCSALCGSIDKRKLRQATDDFVLKGTYTHKVPTQEAAETAIDEIGATGRAP